MSLFQKRIKPDEFVVFYPSYGFNPGDGKDCRIEIRGRIFEQRVLDHLSAIALALAGVPHEGALAKFGVDSVQLCHQRVKDFVLDGESNKQFDVELAGTSTTTAPSDIQGFFEGSVIVPEANLRSLLQREANPWVSYNTTTDTKRRFEGRSRLMRRKGVTVVSDIDDTIKDSNVPDTEELIVNTLFRTFKCTPGMPETYKAWKERQADFVYLTNGPYQLYKPLADYLQGERNYPDGVYCMRLVDLEDLTQSIAKLLAIDATVGTRENPKKHNLIPILDAFPERKFVLVGDSTESDAEIYVDLFRGENFPAGFRAPANGYSDRIKKIYIRDVGNSTKRPQAKTALDRIGDPNIARFFSARNPDIQEDALSVF
jgi:hypothetical protein